MESYKLFAGGVGFTSSVVVNQISELVSSTSYFIGILTQLLIATITLSQLLKKKK